MIWVIFTELWSLNVTPSFLDLLHDRQFCFTSWSAMVFVPFKIHQSLGELSHDTIWCSFFNCTSLTLHFVILTSVQIRFCCLILSHNKDESAVPRVQNKTIGNVSTNYKEFLLLKWLFTGLMLLGSWDMKLIHSWCIIHQNDNSVNGYIVTKNVKLTGFKI